MGENCCGRKGIKPFRIYCFGKMINIKLGKASYHSGVEVFFVVVVFHDHAGMCVIPL